METWKLIKTNFTNQPSSFNKPLVKCPKNKPTFTFKMKIRIKFGTPLDLENKRRTTKEFPRLWFLPSKI